MSSLNCSILQEAAAETSSKLKEMEDRANKFKLLALKAKKELTETRQTVSCAIMISIITCTCILSLCSV